MSNMTICALCGLSLESGYVHQRCIDAQPAADERHDTHCPAWEGGRCGCEVEPPCECVQVDVDEWSARYCPAHGPGSPADKRRLKEEAADEARSAALIPYLLGEDPETWK